MRRAGECGMTDATPARPMLDVTVVLLDAGVCMGAAYLAEAGLLEGRIGTTHWALAEKFAARYPQVRWQPDMFVTEDSRVLCSGGVFASMDVSLYLVAKLCGHEVAVQCAKA